MIGDTEQSYGITYKEISGLLDTYTTPHNSFTYSYDNFDRLTRKLGDKHSIQYTYVNGSQRVDTYTISQATSQQTVYAYTYDNLGNITSVKKNGTTISNYEYDKLGRLIREDDCASNVCWVYAYDKAGNLLNKYEFPSAGPNVAHWMGAYPYVGEIVSTYGYSTSGWKDLLTNYNSTTITYDAIGNPLKWCNAINMTWDNRALQHVRLTNGNSVAYQYNADGIRTKKTYSTYAHDYVVDGSTILKETITNIASSDNATTTLYYYYDESGISEISYNGTKYSYVRNLQGDVIAILNSYGGTAVEYKYDAWGNILSVTGSMASTLGAVNPFRYRGYYYDTETEFYYLNSRYYDPQVGRFLNADEPILLGANGGITGYNMFAYCNNNPVMYVDSFGTELEEAVLLGGSAAWLPVVDGPLPIGDLIFVIVFAASICIAGSEVEIQNPFTGSSPFSSSTNATLSGPVAHSVNMEEPIPMEMPVIPDAIFSPVTNTDSVISGIYTSFKAITQSFSLICDIFFSKGGKQNIKDTGLRELSDEEIESLLNDPHTSSGMKQRLRREQKARGTRNKNKRKQK